MRNYCTLLILGFLLSCAGNPSNVPTQQTGVSEMPTSIRGTMKKMPWTKSAQSYCAGGSEYFVLLSEGGTEHILSKDGLSYHEAWEAFDGKQVEIEGEFSAKTIKSDPNEISQRPAGEDDFICQVWVVKKIL